MKAQKTKMGRPTSPATVTARARLAAMRVNEAARISAHSETVRRFGLATGRRYTRAGELVIRIT